MPWEIEEEAGYGMMENCAPRSRRIDDDLGTLSLNGQLQEVDGCARMAMRRDKALGTHIRRRFSTCVQVSLDRRTAKL